MKKIISCITAAALQLLVIYFDSAAQCIQTEFRDGATFTDDASIGVRAWTNVSNATVSDDNRTTVAALILGQKTHYLRVENPGFTIPSTSYVCGVVVEIERSATGLLSNVTDYEVKLIKGGAITGNNEASGSGWPSSDAYASYGNSSDMWGLALTPADVNAGNFGVAVSANLGGISVLPTARIDHVRISLYYNEALPVKLLAFDAHCKEEAVNLSWLTGSENNSDYFSIQRSNDAGKWKEMDRVNSLGNGNVVRLYEWTDKDPLQSLAYYRLTQSDLDGTVTILPTIAVKNNCFQLNDQLVIYPNPVIDKIQIKYFSNSENTATISIRDVNGRIVSTDSKTIKRGNNLIEIETGKLPPGNHYIFQMQIHKKSIEARFVK